MEFEHGVENLPVDTNMSTGSPPKKRDCNACCTRRLPPPGGPRMGGTPATVNRHWRGSGSDDVAYAITDRATRGCCGFHHEGTARSRCSHYGVDSVHTARGAVENVNSYVGREGEPLLRWMSRLSQPLQLDVSSTRCRRSRAEFLDLQQGKHDVHAYAQRARYLVSNIVTNSIDEATKVVTFMKGLRYGPVKTYLFREYPSTLEAATTLAMQEAFSLRQDKLHVNAPRPMPWPAVKRTGGPEPMDLSRATAAGSQQRHIPTNVRCFHTGNNGHCGLECTAPVHAAKVRRDDTGYRHRQPKKLRQPTGAGPPAGDAVERVGIGHACLARLDFEEIELPRSLLDARLATGVVVRTEKRVVRVRFSYREKKFVDELIVLDLDDTFDMVLGMPWLARHDPVIDWAKRTIVRFRSSGVQESDGPAGAAHAPRGACGPPAETTQGAAASDLFARTLTSERVVREKCEPNQKTEIGTDLRGSRSVKGGAVVSTVVDTQVEQEGQSLKAVIWARQLRELMRLVPASNDAPP
ncbi:unnamed protein product [Phytophthora fragariaefolia]|uniref:Unnamed protein product n=1 Tax=Phytophthora fragariaefolia TaxID=1490495 RepID=A0A9W6XZF0_9STRA|nr:unnamed protein product [Phytophthora fragariaefolia]